MILVTLAILGHGALMATTAHAAARPSDLATSSDASPHEMGAGHHGRADGTTDRPSHAPRDDHRGHRTALCGTTLVLHRPTSLAADPVPEVAPTATMLALDAPFGASTPRHRPAPTAPPGVRRALLQIYRI